MDNGTAGEIVSFVTGGAAHVYARRPGDGVFEFPARDGRGEVYLARYQSDLSSAGIEPGLVDPQPGRACSLMAPDRMWRLTLGSSSPSWSEQSPPWPTEALDVLVPDRDERCARCTPCTEEYVVTSRSLGLDGVWTKQDLITLSDERALLLHSENIMLLAVDRAGRTEPMPQASAFFQALADPPVAAIRTSTDGVFLLTGSGEIYETTLAELDSGTFRRATLAPVPSPNELQRPTFDVLETTDGRDVLVATITGLIARYRRGAWEIVRPSIDGDTAFADVAWISEGHAAVIWQQEPTITVELREGTLVSVPEEAFGSLPSVIERIEGIGTFVGTRGGFVLRHNGDAWVLEGNQALSVGNARDIARRGDDILVVGREALLRELDGGGESCLFTQFEDWKGANALTAIGGTLITLGDNANGTLSILEPACKP